MKRVAGLSLVLALSLAGSALAQGGGGMGGGMGRQAPPDHWITADSLVKALGITDKSVAAKVAPHIAEVDKILKAAADDRQKMMAAMQGGGGPPDRQAMMAKNQENQKALDAHFGAIREALPEASRAAFDALEKPGMRMGGGRRGGGGMGGPPGE